MAEHLASLEPVSVVPAEEVEPVLRAVNAELLVLKGELRGLLETAGRLERQVEEGNRAKVQGLGAVENLERVLEEMMTARRVDRQIALDDAARLAVERIDDAQAEADHLVAEASFAFGAAVLGTVPGSRGAPLPAEGTSTTSPSSTEGTSTTSPSSTGTSSTRPSSNGSGATDARATAVGRTGAEIWRSDFVPNQDFDFAEPAPEPASTQPPAPPPPTAAAAVPPPTPAPPPPVDGSSPFFPPPVDDATVLHSGAVDAGVVRSATADAIARETPPTPDPPEGLAAPRAQAPTTDVPTAQVWALSGSGRVPAAGPPNGPTGYPWTQAEATALDGFGEFWRAPDGPAPAIGPRFSFTDALFPLIAVMMVVLVVLAWLG